jgi:3-oxoadipate enol-lactonase
MSIPVELAYDVTGAANGPDVVLSHSLGTTRAIWESQIAALAGERRVISYDHRGHGASAVPPGPYALEELGGDALALLDRLEITRTSWIGISLGGMVGIWLAAHAPERIDRLTVICSSAYAPPPEPWVQRAAAVRAAGSTSPIADTVLSRWFSDSYAATHQTVVDRAGALLHATPAEGYAGCCAVLERLDLRDDLVHIAAPTLVISAAEDLALPPEHGRAIAAAIPGARFELLAHGAHLANIERADAVNQLVIDHLAAPPSPGAENPATAASGRHDG